VLGLTHQWFGWDLDEREIHLAAHLAAAGYERYQIGIMHETRRADEMGYTARLPTPSWDAAGMCGSASDFLRERPADQAPFLLYIGLKEVHRGFGPEEDREQGVATPPYLARDAASERDFAQFQACIQRSDAAVGSVLETLAQSPHAADTLVLLTTDHGIPMNRAKATLHDAGLETAFILRWPAGGITGGAVRDELISNLDVLPTLLELVGLQVPLPVQGRSFAALLQGGDYQPSDAVFGELTYHNYCDPRRSIRSQRHRLIVNFSAAPFFMPAGGGAELGYAAPGYHPPVELYDLATDPHELADIAGEAASAEILRDLLQRLERWMRETRDPLREGTPTPPMHRIACEALRSGVLPPG
jgi:N-sulfoglucosamine sulfohydrolase